MQNEDTPSEVNPFFAIAERMSKPPSSPTMPTDNPFMDLAPSVSTVSQPPAIGSLSAVAGINPDQAAEATKLGTPLGIGQDLALRNMDELRRRSMVASVQRSGMLQNNPRLAQSLLDPVFAAQAHDDLDSLNATSNLFYKVASGIFETRAALLGGWERGFGTVERGELQSRKIFGSATPLDVARLEYLEKRLGDMPPGGVVSMTAEVVAQQLATARSVGTTALIGAAGGAAFGGGVPGAVAGFLSFGAAGLMATTTQTEAGNLYGDMVADGVDPDTARYAALTGGLLNGIIELAGAKIAAAPFKALASKLMKDAVSSAIAKPTTRAAMAIAGKEYAKQVGTETAEEIGQELVAITSEELAKAFDGVDSEMSLKKAMTRLVDAGIAGFQGSLVLGGIGPTANFVVDVKRADVAAKQQEFFDGLDAAKKDGKLPKRNLDAYEGFLARQAKGTTADTVYVQAEAAAQVLAQSGLSAEQLEQSIPGIREQLRNALENGGDVTIPTSVYGARLAGTPLGDALRQHVRLSPEAMSVAQAQEFSRKRDALRQEAQTALAERQEADAAFVESAQKVETTVADQLRQTGMQDIEVRANAELFRDLAVTQAARMGITPEQFYERYPYRVRGPQVVQEGQPLEQAPVPNPLARVSKLLPLSNVLDERGFGPIVHPVDGDEVAADEAMSTVLGGIDVPRKYLNSVESFDYLLGAINRVLLNKSKDSADYDRAAASMGRALRTDLATVDDIVIAAKKLGYAGIEQDLRLETEESLTKTDVLEMLDRFAAEPELFEQAAMLEQAPVSPGFYSALAKAVDAIDAKSLAPSGWKERIKGLVNKGEVKQDEVDWSGLTDWLDMQEGKVTKEAVAEFLKNNGVRVERVQLGGAAFGNLQEQLETAQDEYAEAQQALDDTDQTDETAYAEATARANAAYNRVGRLEAQIERAESDTGTKFGQYTLPGGDNYREVLITLPRLPQDEFGTYLREMQRKYGEDYVANMTEEESARLDTLRQQPAGFRSAHWDKPNVLVHFRLNDRFDADGKRVLFVEEIQSDWGQAGRKRGFKGEVPLAPFVETTDGWLNLGLKHILLEATQGNYDRVAFVNGKQSADRYDLSKQVREISWTGYDSRGATKLVTITPLQGNLIEIPIDDRGVAISTGSQFDSTPLDEIVPKEIAEQIMAERSGDISGNGLKVGGKGMIEFYDKIVPASVNKLLKKYGGGKLGAVVIPGAQTELRNGEIKFSNAEDVDEFLTEMSIRGFEDEDYGRIDNTTAVSFEQLNDDAFDAFSRAAEIYNGVVEVESVDVVSADAQQQPGFPVTPEMVKKLESGLPLFQAARAPRGEFDPAKLMTTLREGRDFSTFAHETAHFYLTILADIARSATGPQQTKADMDALLSWFGIEGATPAERLAKWSSLTIDQQRQYHEQFAYSFEIYLHEGKAPSVEMQSLFNQFAAWLKRVYKSIRDELNATYKAQFGRDLPMMSSEIRLVMDRMLATDEQIARAQAVRGMKALFQTQEQSGMNDAEWAAYQALEQDATDAATAELTKATLKELQWYGNAQSKYLREMQARHDRARKEIREEVSAQVQLEPVYRAMEFLKKGTIRTDTGEVTAATGAFKLDLAKVRAIMPAGFDPASLKYGKYGMVQDGGIDPDMAAGMFGYGSGVELINAILGAKPIKEEIDARTDQRMLDENSDLATPEARQAAVDMAIHNEARARFIAVEQRWLEKQRRPANDMLQAARQVAQDIIGDVVIRTLNPRRYEAAEAEAARTATTAYREPQDRVTAGRAAETKAYNEAIAAGATPFEATAIATQAAVEASVKATERLEEFRAKYGGREPAEVARRAKRQQLVQNQLAREAMLAKEEIAVAGRDFRKFFRSDEKLAKTRDMAPIMAARAILSYYGYGKRGESPAQYLEQLRTYAPDLYDGIAPIVMKSLSGTADYRDLTVTEFRVLRDTVQALWAQARRDRQITVEGERVALDVVLKELTDRLETIGVGERVGQRQAPGPIDRANRNLLTAAALATRVETWADTLDGMAGPGPFTKYVVRPVLQAVDKFKVARNNYLKRFVDLLNTLQLPVGKIAAPEFGYTFGNGNGGIGKAELLGALMHTGNEGNYRKLLLGRGWGELDADGNLDDSRWRSFVARMIAEGKLTKADYDFVQSIWDLLEEIKPLAQRAHFDMYGYYFKEVEATEVVTPFGTYRGGYVPAATDKFMVQDARVKDGMDELEADWRNSLPSTGAGFTKSRVAGYNEALSLDLSVIASHTDSVLRFSIIQPAVKDVNKLLTDREFKALLARYNPVAYESMLKPWLVRTARQQAAMPGMFKLVDKLANGLRKRAALSIFVGNFRNALSNITGWFPASFKVQPKNLKSAFLVYMGDRGRTTQTITDLSPFMAEVLQNQMFELQTTMNDILLNPNKYQKLQQWSQQHGLFAQRAIQNVVSIVTWLGKFNETIMEMKKEGASESEAQAEAVARADAAVRMTQGSQTPESIAAFEFGTPFYRTFTQFGGWGNTMANLNVGEWVKTVRDLGWRSGKSRLIYIYLMGVMVPALVEDAIKRTFSSDWDPEDDETYLDVFLDWFFGSQARYAAGLVPFGSTITTALTAGFTDKTWDDRMLTSPSISVLEASTVGTAKAVVAIVDEDKDITGRNVRDVLTMITTFTGVPVSALGRPAGYLIDVERGEIEPESTYDMIRGMITGTATPESKR